MKDDLKLYDYWAYEGRPNIKWPNGAKVAFWVAPNIEFYEINPPVNPLRKAWPRVHPDVLLNSSRDYGNRAGHWRMMEVMDKYNVRGSVSLNIALIDHHPELIKEARDREWEFFSHGIYNTRYSYEMNEKQERAILEDSIESVLNATGQKLAGYLAPALTHTEITIDLLAEYEFLYTCDLFQDDTPQPLNVSKGKLISMPYSLDGRETGPGIGATYAADNGLVLSASFVSDEGQDSTKGINTDTGNDVSTLTVGYNGDGFGGGLVIASNDGEGTNAAAAAVNGYDTFGAGIYYSPEALDATISVTYDTKDPEVGNDESDIFVGIDYLVGPGTLSAAWNTTEVDGGSDNLDVSGFEVSYSYAVNDGLTITPGIFTVDDGEGEEDTGVVLETAFSF